ncbi:hypothetical protein [Methylomonas sp. AM2-LC]|uniref:hypothetical protein n=1 Tax=Methylomonas sp. AM2-LC TaxID=3153301 RepID=UPI0032665633
MKKKFVVSYEIDYIHRVSVGIEATNQAEAQQIAEQAFNEALIWDDTEAMPLLSDEYHESGDESMVWECELVEQLPEPDSSVRQLKSEQAAMRVCRGLIEAYQSGEQSGSSIAWEELDQLIPVALKALDKKSLAT